MVNHKSTLWYDVMQDIIHVYAVRLPINSKLNRGICFWLSILIVSGVVFRPLATAYRWHSRQPTSMRVEVSRSQLVVRRTGKEYHVQRSALQDVGRYNWYTHQSQRVDLTSIFIYSICGSNQTTSVSVNVVPWLFRSLQSRRYLIRSQPDKTAH